MNRERFWEFFRFCMVGGVSLLMDYAILFALTEWAGIYYLYSSAISFSVTVIFNYWLCVAYVFKDAKKQTTRRAIIFFSTGVVGLGLNQLCMWFFVDVAGLHYLIAKLGATVIVTAWNYLTKRKAVRG
ncbi:MAG: GtrA family protein [Selenomonadaceae bacterium]|nr:GtrA family protein [Selenomonadaceae bacterium]